MHDICHGCVGGKAASSLRNKGEIYLTWMDDFEAKEEPTNGFTFPKGIRVGTLNVLSPRKKNITNTFFNHFENAFRITIME